MKNLIFALAFSVMILASSSVSAQPITPTCDTLKSLPVTDLEQRIEIEAPGFSVLPPRGEHWCYRLMASQGVSFFKLPKFEKVFDGPPELEIAALHLLGAMAMSLKGFGDFGTKLQTPDELKTVVNVLINTHLFPQILEGVVSAEHRFRVMQSNVSINSALGATCVGFDALIEERGNAQAPTLVLFVNLPGNVVCRHPTASDRDLIWVGFGERYVEGDRPTADTMKGEYEPFVQSLRFMPPR